MKKKRSNPSSGEQQHKLVSLYIHFIIDCKCLLQGSGKSVKPKYVYKTVDELEVHTHVVFMIIFSD
jgi:hypothetical protein